MNQLSQLFLDHCSRRQSVSEAVETWVQDLATCDEAPDGTKRASFRYVTALQREMLVFMQGIDLEAVAIQLQS